MSEPKLDPIAIFAGLLAAIVVVLVVAAAIVTLPFGFVALYLVGTMAVLAFMRGATRR